MFGFFKSNPKIKLEKQYKALLEEAMNAQRNGDIRKYSELSESAEEVLKQIDALENKNAL